MTVKALSAEWLALLAAEGGSLPEVPGATARLQHAVAGGPDGEITYVVSYLDGRIVAATSGKLDDVDGTFALGWKDGVKIALGQDELLHAYMQGRAKYVGDVGKVLDVVPVLQSAAHAELVARVGSASEA